MGEQKTISDSKREFHQEFSYVIPPIYRRIADELLVELHLLSHQKKFKVDYLFSVGLISVFNAFMEGYKPQEHLNELFEALCNSNGFRASEIKTFATKAIEEISKYSVKEIETKLLNDAHDSSLIIEKENCYTRITTIGIMILLSKSKDSDDKDIKEIDEITTKVSKNIGHNKIRIEKDISLYRANLEKLQQALDLMKENIKRERKIKEKANKGITDKEG